MNQKLKLIFQKLSTERKYFQITGTEIWIGCEVSCTVKPWALAQQKVTGIRIVRNVQCSRPAEIRQNYSLRLEPLYIFDTRDVWDFALKYNMRTQLHSAAKCIIS
jgi:hypothetical protein